MFLEDMFAAGQDLTALFEGLGVGFALVSIVVGALVCFVGYRIHKAILAMFGFAVGALVGYGIGQIYLELDTVLAMLVAVVGGVIGGGLFVLLYYVGIFGLGAVAGYVTGLAWAVTFDMGSGDAAGLVLALIFGVIALVLHKVVIVLTTAVWGAARMVAGIAYLVGGGFSPLALLSDPGRLEASGQLTLLLVGWGVLSVAGVLTQYRVTGKGDYRRRKGDDEEGDD